MAVLNLRALICIIGLIMAIHIHGNETAVGVPKISLYTGADIVAGAGYSEDTQQLTAQRCYNTIKASTSDQQSYVKLSQASSSAELERELGISVSLSGSYGEFSADAKASYLRTLKENNYAMSLNYYEYGTNQVTVQLAGPGDVALTDSGNKFYKNGKNEYFGLTCGDYYVSSYLQGALLIMGLYIEFRSSSEKTEFEEEAGFSFGSIISAAESVKIASSKRQLTGSITIHAYQIGGEPSKLSQIFNKNSTGDYYALTCSLATMDDCAKAASGLLDYATSNFPKQFSFEENVGLTPVGLAFTEYQPIERIGLTPPVSRVTQEVKKHRHELSYKLRENEYYRQQLQPLFNKVYPVKLADGFLGELNSFSSKVNNNLRILMQSHGGAVDCYNDPDQCTNVKASIDSQITNITISELSFMNVIKYVLTTNEATWCNTGANTETSWYPIFFTPETNKYNQQIQVERVSVTSTHFTFLVKSSDGSWGRQYDSKATSNVTYSGLYCYTVHPTCWDVNTDKTLSPFFFDLYDTYMQSPLNNPVCNSSVNQQRKKNKIRLSLSFK